MLRESGQDEPGLSARHLRASSPPCNRAPEDGCTAIRIGLLDLLVKLSKEACRVRKATNDAVPCRFGYSNQEGLKLPHVFSIGRQVDAEPIPQTAVSVSQMGLETTYEIIGQADIVEASSLIESIYTKTPSDHPPHNLRIRLHHLPRNVLEVLYQ
jgi:hypothetical protein